MALTLKLRSGDIEPLPELTFDAPRVVVGRAQGSDLQLPDPSVSLRHASFRERGSDYVLVDEGSENGSFCGSVRLARQAPHTLRDGDLVRFGRIWLEVRTGPKAAATEAGASRELARQLVEQALEQDDQPRGITVMAESDAGPGPSVRLSRQRHTYGVGSDPKAALRLPELPARCLELRRQGDQVWLRPLAGGPAAELEGGEALEPGERSLWPPGAVLRLGPHRLSFADLTLRVLEQLERGRTERLAEDEPIEPPRGAELDADAEQEEAEDEDESPAQAESTELVPLTESAPAPRSRALPARGRARWNTWDALVFLLALGVLAVSLWAIRWLAQLGA